MIQTETQIGWQDYLAIVLRRRTYFLIPCLAIVLVAMVWGMFLPKIYRAETIMLVQDQNVTNPLISGLAVSTPVGERLRTLKEELLGWTSLSRLVTELKLDKHAKSPIAFETLVKRLQNDINVRMRGNDLISISYEDEDPKLAQTLVNTITNIYMDRNVEAQSAETETAIGVIEEEMKVYTKKLEDSERALREFKELYVTQMPVASQLNEQIVGLEVSLAQLLVENTEEHPTVVQVKRHIEDLKRKRNEEISRVITTALVKGTDPAIYQDLAKSLESSPAPSDDPTVRAAKEAYQAWVNRLDNNTMAPPDTSHVQVVTVTPAQAGKPLELSSDSASISLGPREEQELTRLTRDYEVHSQTYQHMQERLERAKITQRLGKIDEGAKFKILEPARLPLRPVRPNMPKIFFFSLLFGVFVGAGVAFAHVCLPSVTRSGVCGNLNPAVRHPDGANIRSRVERQPRQRLPRHVPDPDVVLLIGDTDRHPRAVGREPCTLIGARRRRDRRLPALPVDPHQRPRRHTPLTRHVHQRSRPRHRRVHRSG